MTLPPLLRHVAPLCAVLCLAACGGGTKLVKHPAQDSAAMLTAPVVVQLDDGTLRAALHAVVLPKAPGWQRWTIARRWCARARRARSATANRASKSPPAR